MNFIHQTIALILVGVLVSGMEAQDQEFDLSHPFLKVDLGALDSPAGIPEVPTFSAEELQIAELGRRLFFDPALSADGSVSCATCHQPEHGFSAPDRVVEGVAGSLGRRHPPSLLNRHLGEKQFWDGRVDSLEEQALQPIENETELATTLEEVLGKLQEDAQYQADFKASFNDGITEQNLAAAIAQFERFLITGDSRIDRFVTAQESVLSRSERQGLWLYESKGGCWQCHSGQNYTDEKFHNTGVSWGEEPLDLGRFEVTEDEEHTGQFKTPTLRNVGMTAPYMHDGSIATLRDVVEFYNEGGRDNPHRDSRMKALNLTEQEIDDLVAFLKALDGRYAWEVATVEQPAENESDASSD